MQSREKANHGFTGMNTDQFKAEKQRQPPEKHPPRHRGEKATADYAEGRIHHGGH